MIALSAAGVVASAPAVASGSPGDPGQSLFAAGVVLMIVVFASLVILMIAVSALSKALREVRGGDVVKPETRAATASAQSLGEASAAGAVGARAGAPGAAVVEGGEGLSPETLAVITAAATAAVRSQRIPPHLVAVLGASAAAAMGVRVRVRRVIALDEDVRSWIAGGRAEVMHSHKLGGVGQFRG